MTRIGVVGFGAVGSAIVTNWRRVGASNRLAAVCVRPNQYDKACAMVGSETLVTTDIDEFLAVEIDACVEAAGHEALKAIGERVLAAGRDLYTLSIGALADEAFDARMRIASEIGRAQILVPAGALAGFDGLLTLREAGLQSVRYISTKPPVAWRGTAAEDMIDLDRITETTTFFRGNAREAARAFPKNANVAAAVAMAGLGFEATEIELAADPEANFNTGRIEAATGQSELSIRMRNRASEDNPKTSSIVSGSVIAALSNTSPLTTVGRRPPGASAPPGGAGSAKTPWSSARALRIAQHVAPD
jgi:aspartate dehydrogenase